MYCTTHLQWLVIFKCQNKCSNDLSYATGQTNVPQKISHILQTLTTPHFVWWDLLKTSLLLKFELGTWHMALLVAAFAEERLDMEIRRQTGNCPGRCPPFPYLPSQKDHLSFPTKFDHSKFDNFTQLLASRKDEARCNARKPNYHTCHLIQSIQGQTNQWPVTTCPLV